MAETQSINVVDEELRRSNVFSEVEEESMESAGSAGTQFAEGWETDEDDELCDPTRRRKRQKHTNEEENAVQIRPPNSPSDGASPRRKGRNDAFGEEEDASRKCLLDIKPKICTPMRSKSSRESARGLQLCEKLPPLKPVRGRGLFGSLYLNREAQVLCSTCGCGSPEMLVSGRTNVVFYTESVPNSWVMLKIIDRKRRTDGYVRRIIPLSYIVRGNQFRNEDCQLKSWDFEGQLNDGTWVLLDSRCNEPFRRREMKVFSIGEDQSKQAKAVQVYEGNTPPMKAFRLTQTGLNSMRTNHLVILAFDVLGTVVVEKYD